MLPFFIISDILGPSYFPEGEFGMGVFMENIGSFPFKSFLFAPGRVSEELMRFCATHRRFRFVPAELGRDPSGECFVLQPESGEVIKARPVLQGYPWILYAPTGAGDMNTNIFDLDPAPDIVLVYIPILAANS